MTLSCLLTYIIYCLFEGHPDFVTGLSI